MWTQAGALLLLLACSLLSADAQHQRRPNIWDDPIKFKSKGNDSCTMSVTGQGDYTRLRVSCKSNRHSYWCEYLGMPHTCGSYHKNPRHYFLQMMWAFRKLHNACQGPRHIRPKMCRKAPDDSQMVFSSPSFPRPWSERPAPQSARPQTPAPTRPDSTSQAPTEEPTTPPEVSDAERMAQQHCWRSFQGICAYVIGMFRN